MAISIMNEALFNPIINKTADIAISISRVILAFLAIMRFSEASSRLLGVSTGANNVMNNELIPERMSMGM